MTAHGHGRPTLRVVEGPRPRPGRRAAEFIRWAIGEFGALGQLAGTVVIERSQRELALANDEVDSAGTVAYYVRQLRAAGVILRTGPIVVDVDALDGLADHHASSRHIGDGPSPRPARPHVDQLPGSALPDVPGGDLAALLIREAELEADLAQARADVSAARASNLRVVLLVTQDPRECANSGLAQGAADRANRESGSRERKEVGIPSLETDQPPTFLEPDRASDDSRARADQSRTNVEPLPFTEVDELVQPLIDWCRANSRNTYFDDVGRAALAPYGSAGVRHAVDDELQSAAADPSIRSPLGRLVTQALRGNTSKFTPPPKPAQPRPLAINDCTDCGGSGRRYSLQQGDSSTTPCDCVAGGSNEEVGTTSGTRVRSDRMMESTSW